jgi:2'-5' RNA ligase
LFVGVGLPEQARTDVEEALAPLRDSAPGLRWTDPETWHLTLAFLGGVERPLLDSVKAAVAKAAAGSAPFTLRLSGEAGTFGGVFWAGLEEAPLLDELAAALRVHFAALGRPPEDRPFHAHVTLARAAKGTRLPEGLVERYAGPRPVWTARTVALMRSRLAVGGPRYEVCQEYGLGEPYPPPG